MHANEQCGNSHVSCDFCVLRAPWRLGSATRHDTRSTRVTALKWSCGSEFLSSRLYFTVWCAVAVPYPAKPLLTDHTGGLHERSFTRARARVVPGCSTPVWPRPCSPPACSLLLLCVLQPFVQP